MFVISDPEESFIVKFHSNEDGLYAAKPGKKYSKFVEMKNKKKSVKQPSWGIQRNDNERRIIQK